MFNPLDPNVSGSYVGLQKRVIDRLRSADVNDRVFEAVEAVYERELAAEHLVLSRPERVRLLHQVMKAVLSEMLAKLEGAR